MQQKGIDEKMPPASYPLTRTAAKQYRYGCWAGQPNGMRWDPHRCAYEIPYGYRFRQCTRKPGYGTDDLFCWQHARIIEKDRR